MRRALSPIATGWTMAAIAAFGGSAAAGETSRVSVSAAGAQASSGSQTPAISADGRFVAFSSYASDLVAGDGNATADVFVRDRLTGDVVRVSVDSSGTEGNGRSVSPVISADARFVAFSSDATNLVAGDENGVMDLFLFDRETGETRRVSTATGGAEGSGASFPAGLSADGRIVAFWSFAGDLVPGDSNQSEDAFVHDRSTGETRRISVGPGGSQGTSWSRASSISADGRFVAFFSLASNIIDGDRNSAPDSFVLDRESGEVTRVSVGSNGAEAARGGEAPLISADGEFVVFVSGSDDLVEGDANGRSDVFVHDRKSGETTRVSVDSAGVGSSRFSRGGRPSADGRFVSFESDASNLVEFDTNRRWDVFLHDRATGATTRVSVGTSGEEGDSGSLSADISADGRFVTFESHAANLVPGDTNGASDVFVHDTRPCAAGAVNLGAGAIADVLFVNDSAGGPSRRIDLLTHVPVTVFMGAPPAEPALARFVLYAWIGVPHAGQERELPRGLGRTCLPTPLSGGSPRLRMIWNNTRRSRLGAPQRASSPAPSIVASLPSGTGRPIAFFLQGIIADPGSAAVRPASVTNGLSVVVR